MSTSHHRLDTYSTAELGYTVTVTRENGLIFYHYNLPDVYYSEGFRETAAGERGSVSIFLMLTLQVRVR